MPWSITTEVSESPLVGSTSINRLRHDSIEIGTHAFGIDARGMSCRFGDHGTGHETPSGNCAELRRGRAVSGDDDRPAGLYLPEYRAGRVVKLSLGDEPAHGAKIA